MKLGLVSNPASGHGRHRSAEDLARGALVRRGHDLLVATSTCYDTSRQAATDLLGEGIDALVVVGGDGMVHLGLDVVAQTDVPMGIIATGTGNDVARHFGLHARDVEAAADIIDAALRGQGRIEACDAIHVTRPDGTRVPDEHEWCMATVGIGIDAQINARANALVWPHGEGRYLAAVLPELAILRPFGYRVTTDSGTWAGPALVLAVANTRYIGGGMELAPTADTSDGLLDVLHLDPVGRLSLGRLVRRIFVGKHLDHPAVHHERTRAIVIEPWAGDAHWLRRPPLAFADGEPLEHLPLRLRAAPGAVRVLLPAAQ